MLLERWGDEETRLSSFHFLPAALESLRHGEPVLGSPSYRHEKNAVVFGEYGLLVPMLFSLLPFLRMNVRAGAVEDAMKKVPREPDHMCPGPSLESLLVYSLKTIPCSCYGFVCRRVVARAGFLFYRIVFERERESIFPFEQKPLEIH